jgi:ADP-ribose pyrophosphatase
MELVEIPAGLLDVEGEDYCLAAQRELAEEAELQAGRWDVLVDIFSTPGACEESLRVFLARDLSSAPRPQGFVPEDEEAEMTSTFAPRAAIVEMILKGECESPSLVSGVLALETARLLGKLDDLRPSDAPWLARQ